MNDDDNNNTNIDINNIVFTINKSERRSTSRDVTEFNRFNLQNSAGNRIRKS